MRAISGIAGPEVLVMHWVVVYEVAMRRDRAGDRQVELEMVVESSKADPDFVKGWWFGDDQVGFAVHIVTDEAAAGRAADDAAIPEEASVCLVGAKAYRLEREA